MNETSYELSIIVTMLGGPDFLDKQLQQLVPQTRGRPIEIIVPHDSTAGDMTSVINKYPQVKYVDMGVVKTEAPAGTQAAIHEIYDVRTAWGLREATGDVVGLLQDCGIADPDWCTQVIEAHRELPHGVIGGAVEHGGTGGFNWAVYFLDYVRFQLPLKEGPARYLTDANVSYKRSALEATRELWIDRYKEVIVNWALTAQGVVMWQRPQIIVWQDRGTLRFAELVVERYFWGRLFGQLRVESVSTFYRLLLIILSPIIPVVLLGRAVKKVFGGRHNRAYLMRYLFHTIAMVFCWSFGEFVGYVTGREFSVQSDQPEHKKAIA